MSPTRLYYPDCPEALIVNLARGGDRAAFEELVRRRQSGVRNFMRRMCNDSPLADDLAQQVFLQVWLNIAKLKAATAFNAWLKKLALSIWLQHIRKKDVLKSSTEIEESERPLPMHTDVAMDLDAALATLSPDVRLCVVLSYHQGMSHQEIHEATEMPLGTIKSHIRRGSDSLRKSLSGYK